MLKPKINRKNKVIIYIAVIFMAATGIISQETKEKNKKSAKVQKDGRLKRSKSNVFGSNEIKLSEYRKSRIIKEQARVKVLYAHLNKTLQNYKRDKKDNKLRIFLNFKQSENNRFQPISFEEYAELTIESNKVSHILFVYRKTNLVTETIFEKIISCPIHNDGTTPKLKIHYMNGPKEGVIDFAKKAELRGKVKLIKLYSNYLNRVNTKMESHMLRRKGRRENEIDEILFYK